MSRATLPRRVAGYVDRPRLLERFRPLDRRLSVLRAPCGFGKSALLNEICHRQREQATPVAWLRLDGEIEAHRIPDYLALALERGGFDLSAIPKAWGDGRHARDAGRRLGLLLRAIEEYGRPCLLALDEVERLADAAAVACVDLLVRQGPRNLHLAMATRSIPPGIDLATPFLDRQCAVIAAEDLRFTNPEIASFLGGSLSRDELAAAVERTQGWPVALRAYGDLRDNAGDSGAQDAVRGDRGAIGEFLGERLMRDLDPAGRGFLLDFALFESIDPPLVDEVFEGDRIAARKELLAKLAGLFRPAGQTGSALCLHPLVREYCTARHRVEDAGRCRRLHAGLAIAMARQGDLNEAVRHAVSAGDDVLFGEILGVGSGAGLLFGIGVKPFLDAMGHLRPDVAETVPRLALMRCVALLLTGERRAARVLFDRAATGAGHRPAVREDENGIALRADRLIAQAMLLAFTCRAVGDAGMRRVVEESMSLVERESLDPVVRGSLCTLLCIDSQQRARFGHSRQWRSRAKRFFSLAGSDHGNGFIDIQQAAVAMAQGRVRDALAAYSRVGSSSIAAILQAELQIERNRMPSRRALGLLETDPGEFNGWLDIHAAAHGNRMELAYDRGGSEAALSALEASLKLAVRDDLGSLARILAAQLASSLAAVGQVDEALLVWHRAELPIRHADQVDLDRQSWREMEAIACARVGLLRAGGDFEEARRLARSLRDTASAWGLKRTLMRCLVEWMILEYQAMDTGAAALRLQDFLRLYRTTDYSRPLARNPEASVAMLGRLGDMEIEPDIKRHAEALRHEIGEAAPGGNGVRSPRYSAQEIKVLKGLARGQRDKEIARSIGLSENGVRYHLKNIYRKLGVGRRGEAVRRARSAGVI